MRRSVFAAVLMAVSFSSAGCWELFDDRTVDTCLDLSCNGWQVEEGSLESVPTWNRGDLAGSLVGMPARVSRDLPSFAAAPNVDCLTVSYQGVIADDAQLTFEADYNDDGVIDVSSPLIGSAWHHESVVVRAPAEFSNLRVSLQKTGPGAAKLARFDISLAGVCDTLPAVTLPDGTACSLDATCSSQRCVLGQCASCGASGCAEGEACERDGECADGVCAAGLCRACAKEGSCVTGNHCSADIQCASGVCTAGSTPSRMTFPGLDGTCGECSATHACASGECVLGRCSGCATDAECTGGQVCRYLDPFDATQRGCVPKLSSALPRGALCESDLECQAPLKCGASEGRAKRCGFSCGEDTDCQDGVCSAPGAQRINGQPSAFSVLPDWDTLAGRIFTCYTPVLAGAACEVQEQCAGTPSTPVCCLGHCTGTFFATLGDGFCSGSGTPAPN